MPHPYSAHVEDVNRGSVRFPYNGQIYTHHYMFGIPPDIVSGNWDANDENKLLAKLSEKIRGHDFNAGVFLGTIHQTWRLIADNASKLASGLIALKRGRGVREILRALGYTKGQARRLSRQNASSSSVGFLRKDLSGRWLEVSYGWIPLVQDIYEAGEAFASESLTRTIAFRVKSQRSFEGSGSDANTQFTHMRTIRKQIIYNLTASSIAGRLGLTSPSEVLWELTPWSFVIDWMLPIGSYLANRAFFSTIQGSWVATVTIRDTKTATAVSMPALSPYRSFILDVTRTVGDGPLQVPIPQFKSPLSKDWRRAANAIALLNQLR